MATGTPGDDNLQNDPSVRFETVDAQGGADRITLTPVSSPLGGATTVSGGDGFDTLAIELGGSPYFQSVTATDFDGAASVRLSSGSATSWTVDWTSIERLEFSGKPYGNFTFATGATQDILRLQTGSQGELDIRTGAGADQIYVSGQHEAIDPVQAGADGDIIDFTGASIVAQNQIIVLQGEAGADVILGSAGRDQLEGGADNDILYGGGGTDLFYGGTGDDSIFVDDALDGVVEGAGGGFDVVYASVSYTLSAGAEVEILATANNLATTAINLTGNAGADFIIGNAGANTLDGAGGRDYLDGRGGNDTYLVDSADAVLEAVNGGYDIAYARSSFALGAGAEVEVLATIDNLATTAIDLTGNEFANLLIGNAGANILDGRAGRDYLDGRGGNDSYFVDEQDVIIEAAGAGFDYAYASASFTLSDGAAIEVLATVSNLATTAINLTGNANNDYIIGNEGANTLDGSRGRDYLDGRGGNDSYFVDDARDTVIEAPGGGFDIVYASADFALSAGTEVEILATVDNRATTAINLTGNANNDYLIGNEGANVLDGGGGRDYLEGRGGDDFYLVDHPGDTIIEASGGGYDVVNALVDFTLTAGAEVEVLATADNLGATPLHLVGNERDNFVVGNAGANTLDGGAGNDTLAGGEGADRFAFTTALGAGNIDLITAFQSGTDQIALHNAIFTGLAPGALLAGAFVEGSAAQDAGDRIVYDQALGALYFDVDGLGGAAMVQFASVQAGSLFAASDFVVI